MALELCFANIARGSSGSRAVGARYKLFCSSCAWDELGLWRGREDVLWRGMGYRWVRLGDGLVGREYFWPAGLSGF